MALTKRRPATLAAAAVRANRNPRRGLESAQSVSGCGAFVSCWKTGRYLAARVKSAKPVPTTISVTDTSVQLGT